MLNSGASDDDVRKILSRHENFSIAVVQYEGGIALELKNAPDLAFVGTEMMRGIREHLFAVLRDLLYAHDDVLNSPRFDLASSEGITDAVFHILRNARVLRAHEEPRLVVCWGGHAIEREEYDYTKVVGYALGLQGLDICTGCGAGAMKGPMKGATVGHAKQRIRTGRYLGLTEPTIIAAESPNPIVNELVILPDMEKRLEAFVRMAHAIIVFPGGVGTAEEILYLLGILLSPANAAETLPVIFTGPTTSKKYFERMHDFIGATLGARRAAPLPGDPRRRRGRRGGRDERLETRPRPARGRRQRLFLQLGARHRSRLPEAVRGDARIDARARAAPRSAGAQLGGQSAPRVLGRRRGQRA